MPKSRHPALIVSSQRQVANASSHPVLNSYSQIQVCSNVPFRNVVVCLVVESLRHFCVCLGKIKALIVIYSL